jgi:hypothetical protein
MATNRKSGAGNGVLLRFYRPSCLILGCTGEGHIGKHRVLTVHSRNLIS